MKPPTLVLQVAIVVAGIFVYDQFLEPNPPPAAPLGEVVPSHEFQTTPEPERADSPTPMLKGPEAAVLRGRIETLIARVDGLEAVLRTRPAPVRETATGSRSPFRLPSVEGQSPAPLPPETTFTAEEVARFRALQQAALRHRRAEQIQEQIAKTLDGVDVSLRDDVRGELIGAALRIWWAADDTRRKREEDPAGWERYRETSDRLREELRAAVGRIMGGTDADAVSERLIFVLGLHPAALVPSDGEQDAR